VFIQSYEEAICGNRMGGFIIFFGGKKLKTEHTPVRQRRRISKIKFDTMKV